MRLACYVGVFLRANSLSRFREPLSLENWREGVYLKNRSLEQVVVVSIINEWFGTSGVAQRENW